MTTGKEYKKKWGKEGLQEGMTTGKEGKDHKKKITWSNMERV